MFTFDCPDCNSKTEYSSESEDVESTIDYRMSQLSNVVRFRHDTNTTTKSKFDKTNYRKKIAGIENQLDLYGKRGLGSKSYTSHVHTVNISGK